MAPDLASIVKPVIFGHSLPLRCSSDLQEWIMEIHINKTTRGLEGLCRADALRQHTPPRSWRTDAGAWTCCFPGQRGLEPFLLLSGYRCLFHQVSLPQNGQKRHQRGKKIFQENQGGCVLFLFFLLQGLCNQQEGLWGWDSRIYSLVNLGVASSKQGGIWKLPIQDCHSPLSIRLVAFPNKTLYGTASGPKRSHLSS